MRVVCGMTDGVPTTDASAYLRAGASVWAGDGYRRNVKPELHFPPVAPVLLGGASEVLGDPLTGGPQRRGLGELDGHVAGGSGRPSFVPGSPSVHVLHVRESPQRPNLPS